MTAGIGQDAATEPRSNSGRARGGTWPANTTVRLPSIWPPLIRSGCACSVTVNAAVRNTKILTISLNWAAVTSADASEFDRLNNDAGRL